MKTNLIVSGGARATSIASGLLVAWAINIGWGPEYFGIYAAATSLLAMAGICATLGLDSLVLFHQSREGRTPRFDILAAAIRLGILSSVVACAAILSGIYLAKSAGASTHTSPIYEVVAYCVPGIVITGIYSAWHQGRKQFIRSMLTPKITDALRAVTILILAIFHAPISWVAASIFATTYVPPILYKIAVKRTSARAYRLQSADRKFMQHSLLTSFARTGVDHLDIILVSMLTTAEETATYALASRLASLALLGNQMMQPLSLPSFGRQLALGRIDRAAEQFNSHRSYAVICSSIIGSALLLAGTDLAMVFGRYEKIGSPLVLLCITHVICCSFGPTGNLLKASGSVRALNISGWILVVIRSLMILLFVPEFGVVGAAFSALFSLFLTNVVNAYQCRKFLGLQTQHMISNGSTAFALTSSILYFVGLETTAAALLLAIAVANLCSNQFKRCI
ncbi:MAG: polysaccharide biosynthesis C-terminal domain-containing protein [Pseudomonadota bacterium]|nr:polysaccharide biosynthesis C-terminal domain-containing protein [Pseudomonadota bacterium]